MKFLRDHWIALLLASFVTLVVAFPLYSFPIQAGADYQGVNLLPFGTDQMFYLARANEIISGRRIGNPVLASGKDVHDPFFTLNDTVAFGSLGFLTGGLLSAPQLQILITLVGVFVLSLLFTHSLGIFITAVGLRVSSQLHCPLGIASFLRAACSWMI